MKAFYNVNGQYIQNIRKEIKVKYPTQSTSKHIKIFSGDNVLDKILENIESGIIEELYANGLNSLFKTMDDIKKFKLALENNNITLYENVN